jgi:hypothetical protein
MDESTKAAILIAAAIAGTFCHWAKKRLRDNLPGGPIDYLITSPWNTVAMFGTMLAACAAITVSGQLVTASAWMVASLGYTAGWTADSAINKGPGQ